MYKNEFLLSLYAYFGRIKVDICTKEVKTNAQCVRSACMEAVIIAVRV